MFELQDANPSHATISKRTCITIAGAGFTAILGSRWTGTPVVFQWADSIATHSTPEGQLLTALTRISLGLRAAHLSRSAQHTALAARRIARIVVNGVIRGMTVVATPLKHRNASPAFGTRSLVTLERGDAFIENSLNTVFQTTHYRKENHNPSDALHGTSPCSRSWGKRALNYV